ncbi:fimbrial protein [Atlantibacter sp.]|uniref:fimbrial protein n=1 Tax=Atlantibacter sp. TaxID=1903473 RepID=UPI0028AD61F9|nr:fimbrial protein [Atlantibacter sp.]
MKMNSVNHVLLPIVLISAGMSGANAADTITFNGKVIDTTCTVVVNGGDSTIEIGSIPKEDVANKGDTGAPKSFNISLESCPLAAVGVPTQAYIKFSGPTDGDPSYFKNVATNSAALNVGVLLKQGSTVVKADADNDPIILPPAGGNVTEDYTAQLVATNAGSTVGNVTSVLTYNVSYL